LLIPGSALLAFAIKEGDIRAENGWESLDLTKGVTGTYKWQKNADQQ
jgi:hypothetical protein